MSTQTPLSSDDSQPVALTPTQRRILGLLADGRPHRRKEIHGCLDDELSAISSIRFHLCNLRKILAPTGEWIVCELHRGAICYRRVRLLHAPNTSVCS